MKKISLQKTLNLHQFSSKFNIILSNRKIIFMVIITIIGLVAGTHFIKGEEGIYHKIGSLTEEYILNYNYETVYTDFIIHLVIPSLFALILFFGGLSIFGGMLTCILPAVFSFTVGTVAYYLYSVYTLKGLAYCVIMLFPYITLSLLSLIMLSIESISMSQYLLNILNNKKHKFIDYSINRYYVNCLKSYALIIVAAIIKASIDSLFIGLFRF